MTTRKTRPHDWTELLDDLDAHLAKAQEMGGPEKLAKQRAGGRFDARQRIVELCDPGSFREIGALVGSLPRAALPPAAADALVGGVATIDGRPVVIGSEDFTVQGGSIGIGTHAKRVRLAELALRDRVPLVMFLEGAGERMTNALERYPHAPNDLQILAELSGKVPTVAVVMGASAGHGVLTALLMDFVVMVQGAAMFSAGPPLVEAAIGEKVSKEDLGGARMHVTDSGVAHNLAENETEAFALVRKYLTYFPLNAWQRPATVPRTGENGERRLDGILELVPRNPSRPYDMRHLLEMLVDTGSLFEVQPLYGASMVTALARLGGQPVGIVANQPMVLAGAVTRQAADKAAHFLDLADAFHLPVIFLADNPGIMAGTQAEREGTLRSAARMYAAQARLRVPKLHVTLRKAFGFGSSLMAMNPFDRQSITLAFPGISLGGMPAAGGGTAAKVSDETQAQLEAAESAGAWKAADNLSYDAVIDPRDLRNALLTGLRLSAGRVTEPPAPAQHTGVRP
ncbi:MAG: acyl-CoA carboxylase subunit beta [Candidatus Binatia bacterium]